MIFAQLAVIASLQSSSTPSTVTYSNAGARLERLLPELSSACGLTLVPSEQMRDVILAVRLDKAPLDETLNQIAMQSRGVWMKLPGKLELKEDASGIQLERDAQIKRHVATIRDGLAKWSKYLEAPVGSGPVEGEFAERELAMLLPALDIDELTALPPRGRIVYSNRPRPLQRALPNGCDDILKAIAQSFDKNVLGEERDPTVPLVSSFTKADLAIAASPDANTCMSFELHFYDTDGRAVGTMRAVIDPPPKPETKSFPPPDHPLPEPRFDPKVLHLFKVMNAEAEMTPDEHAALLHPLENDPASLVGSLMVSYSDQHSEQLVANLTDASFFEIYQSIYDKPTAISADVLAAAGVLDDKGWLTLRRAVDDPTGVADRATMDRHSLRDFVNTVQDDANPDLKAILSAIRGGMAYLYWLPQGSLYPGLANSTIGTAFRLLSLFHDDEIGALLAGQAIPANRLSPSSQNLLYRRIMGGSQLQIGDPESESPANAVRKEPTNAADGPVPSGGYVTLSEQVDVGLLAQSSAQDRPRVNSIEDVAMSIFEESKSARYRIVAKHNLDFRWYVAPGLYWKFRATYHEAPKDDKWLTLSELPKDVQSRIDAKVKQYKATGNGGGGQPPPPQ